MDDKRRFNELRALRSYLPAGRRCRKIASGGAFTATFDQYFAPNAGSLDSNKKEIDNIICKKPNNLTVLSMPKNLNFPVRDKFLFYQ